VKRTSAGALLAVGVAGLVMGFLIDQLLTASGQPTFTPSLMLPVLLVVLGAVTVALAIPIRRATTGASSRRVDPFRALRIAMLARSSSIVGSLVAGVALGLLLFLVTRPVGPSLGSVGAVVAAAVGALLLVVAGLVAEYLCTIRKDDDDEQPGEPDPGFGLSHQS
jgi:uncharacterized membrane protein YidH (DUF202 family)